MPTELTSLVRDRLAEVIGMPAGDISDGMRFDDLGVDSILRMELVRALGLGLGVEVEAAEVYEHDTVVLLAELFAESVAAQGGSPPEPPAEPRERALPPEPVEPTMPAEPAGPAKPAQPSEPSEPAETPADGLAAPAAATARTAGPPRLPQSADDAGPGPTVIVKRELDDRPQLRATLDDLHARYAVESGLAGRDIAPLAFLGAGRTAYFNFSARERNLLAWSYVGSDADFPALAADYVRYAREHDLKANSSR